MKAKFFLGCIFSSMLFIYSATSYAKCAGADFKIKGRITISGVTGSPKPVTDAKLYIFVNDSEYPVVYKGSDIFLCNKTGNYEAIVPMTVKEIPIKKYGDNGELASITMGKCVITKPTKLTVFITADGYRSLKRDIWASDLDFPDDYNPSVVLKMPLIELKLAEVIETPIIESNLAD